MSETELEQLIQKSSDPVFRKNLARLFALRSFWDMSIHAPDYQPGTLLTEAIALSAEGDVWHSKLGAQFPNFSDSTVKAAIFLKFYHDGLLVDVLNTDVAAIENALNAELLGSRIRFPWVYEHVLYDRFSEIIADRVETLNYEQTTSLLEHTPEGVFQLQNLIVGPLGILESTCNRDLPPVRSAGLWHCSDPSCRKLHTVRLSGGLNELRTASSHLAGMLRRSDGKPSEWGRVLESLEVPVGAYYSDIDTQHLPSLLANAFTTRELQALVQLLLEHHGQTLRACFPKTKRFKDLLSGSAQKIAERLQKAHALQISLLMPDDVVITCLEEAIEGQNIVIPATEIRGIHLSLNRRGWFNIIPQCSRLGVRFIPKTRNTSVSRLRHLVDRIYESQEEQLAWKLRNLDINSPNLYERLDIYLHTEDPKRIIRELVLDSPGNLSKAYEIVKYGRFSRPGSIQEEEFVIDKLLWKLGFNVGLYPPYQQLFWDRMENLLETARTYHPYNENDRERIRSVAVNFFVSLEEILDFSLSFSTWALLADHPIVTTFNLNFDDARKLMASALNYLTELRGLPLSFDPMGKNTLYPLIQGFALLADILQGILKDSQQLERPSSELPGYVGKTEIALFPFLHKCLVLDLQPDDTTNIVELLQKVTRVLEAGQVSDVRNRIEHKRLDFPTQDEIDKALAAVRDIVNQMEKMGLCPTVYLYSGETRDSYGRTLIEFRDYKSRCLTITKPSQYDSCGLPNVLAPQVLVPCMRIGNSSQLMRFQFHESSDYVETWKLYPRTHLAASTQVPSAEVAT